LKYKKDIARKFVEEKRQNAVYAKAGVFELVIILDSLKETFNAGKIFRSAEIFSVKEVHLIQIPFFDPFPAKGAVRYVPMRCYDSFSQSYEHLKNEGYEFYVFDAQSDVVLGQTQLAKKATFVFGPEAGGFSFAPEKYPDLHKIRIQQFGKIESLNVSIAASIAMYEYVRQHS